MLLIHKILQNLQIHQLNLDSITIYFIEIKKLDFFINMDLILFIKTLLLQKTFKEMLNFTKQEEMFNYLLILSLEIQQLLAILIIPQIMIRLFLMQLKQQ